MVPSFSRASRVEDQIQREVSNIILHRVKDPRLEGVTITRVQVSRDLKRGVVFYCVLGQNEEAKENAAQGLNSARGFIKRELGARMRIKFLPSIAFEPDPDFGAGTIMDAGARDLD